MKKKQKRTVEDVVFEIVSDQMGVDKGELTRETHFYNDLNSDSLDAVELLMEFEDAFELSIPDEEAEKTIYHTIGGVIDYIERVTGNKECLWAPWLGVAPAVYVPPSVADTDTNLDGDVTQGLLPNVAIFQQSEVRHLAVGSKVYHVIHHLDDARLEIIERPNLLITGGDLIELVKKATAELQKPY